MTIMLQCTSRYTNYSKYIACIQVPQPPGLASYTGSSHLYVTASRNVELHPIDVHISCNYNQFMGLIVTYAFRPPSCINKHQYRGY